MVSRLLLHVNEIKEKPDDIKPLASLDYGLPADPGSIMITSRDLLVLVLVRGTRRGFREKQEVITCKIYQVA